MNQMVCDSLHVTVSQDENILGAERGNVLSS
jgi:hypothetical protein